MSDKETIQALRNEIELLQREVDKLKAERIELTTLIVRLLKEKYNINNK